MKKLSILCAVALTLTLFSGCTLPGGDPMQEFADLKELPLSSIRAVEEKSGNTFRAKFRVPETDTYRVEFSQKAVSSVKFYKEDGTVLAESKEGLSLDLEKGEILYAEYKPVKTSVNVRIEGTTAPQPFDILGFADPSSYETTSADPTVSPLKPARLSYEKRADTLYVYSNAPETLTPDAVNKCITRQSVSNQSVYFTFEHQSTKLVEQGMESNGVYYGYRVTNTGTEDMYVTVKNVGFQMEGNGTYHGEKEWIDFYNLPLRIKKFENMSTAEKDYQKLWFNFCNTYSVHEFYPTTYRVPAGEFMYVIGGTTEDAFGGYNVADTADCISTNSEVSNGAVVFDVVGEAEGAFYIYNDIAEVNKGGSGYDTHLGVRNMASPAGSVGQEEGYVVDNEATWIFNDATKAQNLPVTFENYYNASLTPYVNQGLADEQNAIKASQKVLAQWIRDNYPDCVSTNIAEDGSIIPCSPIPEGQTAHIQNEKEWVTHSDSQHYANAVGTDITVFHTVNSAGTNYPVEEIAFGLYNFSTQGIVLEMGNWMKDYQDAFTFVNQGNNPRKICINIYPSGAIAAIFRDRNGVPIPGRDQYGLYHGILDYTVHEEFEVPAHSVLQIVCEYNLCANSNGHVRHNVQLV